MCNWSSGLCDLDGYFVSYELKFFKRVSRYDTCAEILYVFPFGEWINVEEIILYFLIRGICTRRHVVPHHKDKWKKCLINSVRWLCPLGKQAVVSSAYLLTCWNMQGPRVRSTNNIPSVSRIHSPPFTLLSIIKVSFRNTYCSPLTCQIFPVFCPTRRLASLLFCSQSWHTWTWITATTDKYIMSERIEKRNHQV